MYDVGMWTSADKFRHENELAEIAGILNAQHARLVGVAAGALADGRWGGEGIQSDAGSTAATCGADHRGNME
jgi:hypothetical protein